MGIHYKYIMSRTIWLIVFTYNKGNIIVLLIIDAIYTKHLLWEDTTHNTKTVICLWTEGVTNWKGHKALNKNKIGAYKIYKNTSNWNKLNFDIQRLTNYMRNPYSFDTTIPTIMVLAIWEFSNTLYFNIWVIIINILSYK